ncbi:MAG: hypothetical protein ACRDHU_02335 [Actinomycetota bacterium]
MAGWVVAGLLLFILLVVLVNTRSEEEPATPQLPLIQPAPARTMHFIDESRCIGLGGEFVRGQFDEYCVFET